MRQSLSQSHCVVVRGLVRLFVVAGALQIVTAAARRDGPPFGAQGDTSHAKVELIADRTRASSAGETMWAGVLFHLDPGWHIYWENAGDSGTPPKINWQLPAGYHAGAIRWPTPVRLGHESIVDYGYEGEVLLMVPIERSRAQRQGTGGRNGATSISADVRYVVCSDICIPGRAHLNLSLLGNVDSPVETAKWHAIFERTRAELPKPAPASWAVSAQSGKDDFVLSIRPGTGVRSATFFPLNADEIENSAPQAFAPTSDGFRLTLRKSEQLTKPLTSLKGLLVLGRGEAFQVTAPIATR
jgi:DsbC/DsbD-like thiol-disulfide interchange protein